ncbi:ATP synthase subunit I [Ferrimonas senticii]|uniref:ATP synthase subunit I n=1 Tax=Ferrimonas senticii TaxID=394566 RepID=UPI000482DD87|nr:ATP synthase subunit I [Ferrimonas senticii]
MIKHPSQIGRERAFRFILLQAVVVSLISVACFVFWDVQQALLLLIGGGIAVLPNLVFVALTMGPAKGRGPGQLAQAFYRGVTIKLLLTMLLFAVTLALLKPQGVAVFVGFIVVQLQHWLAPLLFQPKQLG